MAVVVAAGQAQHLVQARFEVRVVHAFLGDDDVVGAVGRGLVDELSDDVTTGHDERAGHLRRIAAQRLPRDDRRFTLETSDLVHEAYLKLLGYEWDEAEERFRHKTMVNLDAIGPAGSINSTANDMALWVRMLLARGKLGSKQIATKATELGDLRQRRKQAEQQI